MAAPHDISEGYARVTRHLVLREYGQACTELEALWAGVPRPRRASGVLGHNALDLAASGATGCSSGSGSGSGSESSSWDVVQDEEGTLAIWDSIDPQTLRALKLGATVYTSIYAGMRDGAGRRAERGVEDLPAEMREVLGAGGVKGLFEFVVRRSVGVLSSTPGSGVSSTNSSPARPSAATLNQPGSTPTPTPTPFHELPLGPLPPALLVTLVLAALKLAPPLVGPGGDPSATVTARDLVEAWLAQVPDEVVLRWTRGGVVNLADSQASLGSESTSSSASSAPETAASPPRPIVDQAPTSPRRPTAPTVDHRTDYLRLIELYVLELLPRAGDWDAAADWVRSDGVIGAKRREFMFRRLAAARDKVAAAQARTASAQPQTTAGGGAAPTSPRRGSTASSSESELTARPGDVLRRQEGAGAAGRQQGARRSTLGVQADEAAQDVQDAQGSDDTPIPIPAAEKGKARDPAQRSAAMSPSAPSDPPSGFAALRARLTEFLAAANARDHVASASNTTAGRRAQSPIALAWSIVTGRPYTVLTLLFVALAVRRTIMRRRQAGSGASPTAAPQTTPSAGGDSSDVQARIRAQLARGGDADWTVQVRNAGWLTLHKIRETIRMGTKITYV